MNSIIKFAARKLRRESTPAEKILWKIIRNKKYNNLKFYRKYPLRFNYDGRKRFFVADFYCYACKLVIELDGPIHNYQKDYDELRTYIMNVLISY